MGLTDMFGKKHVAKNEMSDDRLPENPLAPRPTVAPSNASAGSGAPASFTPLQLRGSVTPSAHSAGSSVSRHSTSDNGSDSVRDIKAEILANWLHTKQEERIWTFGSPGEGVFMKKSKGNYACAPFEVYNDGTGLHHAVTELNVRASSSHSNTT
jgi:hypothetical protein